MPINLNPLMTCKMLQRELNNHLGYDTDYKEPMEHDNRQNGYGNKTLKTSFGEVAIDVPRDWEPSFEPELILALSNRRNKLII